MAGVDPVAELFSLSGRRALVTGASRGLGRSLAEGLAELGADVALAARSAEALEETAAAVRAHGREAVVLDADLSRSEDVESAFERLDAAWDRLDVLVNNAGTNVRRSLSETADEDWRTVLATNLDAAFYCARAAAPRMRSGGRIVNIGSVAGNVAIPTGVAYAASKGALEQMTRSLAQELAPAGIAVNCVAPWYFRTPLTAALLDDPAYMERVLAETPMGRIGDPRDLLGAVAWFCGPSASWVTGQVVAVDGGMSTSRFRA